MTGRRLLLWRLSLRRAVLEVGLFGGALHLGAVWRIEGFAPGTLAQATLFLATLTALWHALRLELPQGNRWRRLGHEAGAVLGHLLLALTWLLLIYLLGWWDRTGEGAGRSGLFTLFVLGGAFEFLILRAGVWLWYLWQGLRRRRLLWELTHMQVQFVLLLALIPAAGMAIVIAGTRQIFGLDLLVRTVFPVLGVVSAGLALLLVGILPPAVLLAYLTARRTNQRLDALAETAALFRQGDYSARTPVSGQDEVAQLQQDFNAMAAGLEETLQELETERDKVAALLRARRELMAAVSHELRTPVAIIQGYLENTREEWNAAPGALREDLGVIQEEVGRLQRLIDDLFTLSQAEVGQLALQLEPTDVGSAVLQVVGTLAPLAWQRGRVEVVAEVPPDLPLALADGARLRQVLVNLVRNAVRHTLPGGIVAVLPRSEGEWIAVEVRDTGQGIPAEELPHIWERFYRGERAREDGSDGAGLGLALVKEMVEAMGGSVSVESTAGEGSAFMIRLPKATNA
jgi:signal transduction histidine kinase